MSIWSTVTFTEFCTSAQQHSRLLLVSHAAVVSWQLFCALQRFLQPLLPRSRVLFDYLDVQG